MVSACAYSGAYPTGYGRYQLNTEGVPPQLHDGSIASGFTHFQQSGTGAIRKYYNYFRVTPMLEPLDALGQTWELPDERAEPGYYAATLSFGHPLRAHRRPEERGAPLHLPGPPRRPARHRLLAWAAWPSRTARPSRCGPTSGRSAPASPRPRLVVEGAPLAVHVECDAGDWRQLLWYDRRLMPGGTRLDFDRIRPTTLRPVRPDVARGRPSPARCVELRFGFSLRGVEQARDNLQVDCPPSHRRAAGHRRSPGRTTRCSRCRRPGRLRTASADTPAAWRDHLAPIRIETPSDRPPDGLRHRALPLADQALLRARARARSGPTTVRSRSTSAPCGTSTGPSCR